MRPQEARSPRRNAATAAAAFCSVRCGALWRNAHGQFQRTREWEDDPELSEFVALLFPDTSNREIAQAVGLNMKRIEHFARSARPAQVRAVDARQRLPGQTKAPATRSSARCGPCG
jgi:hypothetical protein